MTFAFVMLVWIFSVCLHEFAHAAVAYAGGDYSVKDKGYLSLNPLKFSDPLLSIGLPVLFVVLGGIGLPGGAVYIEHHRLRSRGWDCIVSLAGPAANVVVAILLAAPFWTGLLDTSTGSTLGYALAFLVQLQIFAVLLNLIPIPPLDGFGALSAWFDPLLRAQMRQHGTTGLFILFLVLWYVEPVNRLLWTVVGNTAGWLGVPYEWAWQGYLEFRPF